MGWLTSAVGGLFLLAFAGFLATGANGPNDPALSASTLRQPVAGFGEVHFSVRDAETGAPDRSYCGLLAETPATHQQGMTGRRDLAGYDAMIFRFDTDQTGTFWNRNVPIALSIAWFDAGGKLVSTSEMPPCGDSDQCPLYGATAPYRYALEVPQGGLARFEMRPGIVLTAAGPCPGGAPEG